MAGTMLSMTTDFRTDRGCPGPDLQLIAEAGFTHVHWCHHWAGDFIYADCEIEQIARWLREYGLQVCDLHGTSGEEKDWCSPREHERQAGVELVINRIDMAASLGSDVVIMHLSASPAAPGQDTEVWDRIRRTFDALRPAAGDRGVRIAIENGSFDDIEKVLGAYGPDFVGLCYDSGHGNLAPGSLDRLEKLKGRLISVHLHDNGGDKDSHKLPFMGTVDWDRLAKIIAASSYRKCVSTEAVIHNTGIADSKQFLADGLAACERVHRMIEGHRQRGDAK